MTGFKDHKVTTNPKWLPAAAVALLLGTVGVFLFLSSSSTTTSNTTGAVAPPANGVAAGGGRALAPEPVFEPEEPTEDPVEEPGEVDPEDVEVAEAAVEPSPSPKPDTPLVETHVKCFQSAEYDEICTYDLLCFDGDKVREPSEEILQSLVAGGAH